MSIQFNIYISTKYNNISYPYREFYQGTVIGLCVQRVIGLCAQSVIGLCVQRVIVYVAV